MQALEDYLLRNKQAIAHRPTQRKTFLLHGLTGMGKTQLAAAFAREHHEECSAVLWLDGSSVDRLEQSFVNFAGRFPSGELSADLKKGLESIPPDVDAVVRGVLQWLSLPSNKHWLMIIDNIDRDWNVKEQDPLAYHPRKYFPQADHGSILVTSRLVGMLELPDMFEAELHVDQTTDAQAKGIFESDAGRESEAEAMYERVLAGYEKALGLEHRSTLDTVNSLGNLYRDQGRLAEAEDMYERALAGCEKALGAEQINMLHTINHLGHLYSAQGKLSEAEAMFRRTLAGFAKALGFDHAFTPDSCGQVLEIALDRGQRNLPQILLERDISVEALLHNAVRLGRLRQIRRFIHIIPSTPVVHEGVDAIHAAYFYAILEMVQSAHTFAGLSPLSHRTSQLINARIEICNIFEVTGQHSSPWDSIENNKVILQDLHAAKIPAGKHCVSLH